MRKTPYPGPGPKVQISADGGADQAWKGGGGELYYRHGDEMMATLPLTTCGPWPLQTPSQSFLRGL